jgi:DNA-binding LacI/PurR family transcriptional regulator
VTEHISCLDEDMSKAHDNKRPTIRDVASEAGVSYQTVSRVLNDHPRVAPNTREQVLRAMKKLGYQRNVAAQMLTTQRSRTIQLITVDGEFPFELLLFNSAQWGDYSAIYSDCTRATLSETLDKAAARLVEGIFLYAPKLRIDDDDLLAMSHGIPLVRRDFAIESKQITWVGFDQIRATQMAVQHLIDLGHRDIAVVTGTLQAINATWRYESWKKTLIDNGLKPGPNAHGDYTTPKSAVRTGYEGMCQILESGKPFTAVLIANDYMTIGALHALRAYGLRIPDDVSIVSYDNSPHASYLDPPLTTVEFTFDLQNRLAFQFLFERIENPDAEPHQHILLPDLIVRESTRPIG